MSFAKVVITGLVLVGFLVSCNYVFGPSINGVSVANQQFLTSNYETLDLEVAYADPGASIQDVHVSYTFSDGTSGSWDCYRGDACFQGFNQPSGTGSVGSSITWGSYETYCDDTVTLSDSLGDTSNPVTVRIYN